MFYIFQLVEFCKTVITYFQSQSFSNSFSSQYFPALCVRCMLSTAVKNNSNKIVATVNPIRTPCFVPRPPGSEIYLSRLFLQLPALESSSTRIATELYSDCGLWIVDCGCEYVAWSPGDDFAIYRSTIYSKLLRVFLPQYVASRERRLEGRRW